MSDNDDKSRPREPFVVPDSGTPVPPPEPPPAATPTPLTPGRTGFRKMLRFGDPASIGIEIVLAVVLGAVGGHWLDGKFNTAPWLTLFGLVAGIGAAVKAVMRLIQTMRDES